jgi:hypothetical protein
VDINNLNKCIASNGFETVIKNLQTKKSSDSNRFTAEFYQIFKELTPVFLKLFHKIQREGILPN